MFYRIINRLLISTFTMFIISLGLYIFIVAPVLKNLNINELDRIHSQLQQTGNANYYSGVNNYVFKSYYRWIKGSYKSIKNHYLLRERSQNTLILLLLTMFFTLTISFLFGFYSAVFKDSIIDRLLMLFGTIGVALPSFLLALFLLWITIQWFDITAGGFFSTEYLEKNWSFDRVLDLSLIHI